MTTARLRNWCFTMFDYTDKDIENFKLLQETGGAKYIIVGEEVCPETQKKHLQGYVEFNLMYSFKRVKEILGDKLHIEPRQKSAAEAAEYCRKDGKYHEFGAPPKARGQGKRTDFDVVRKQLVAGSSLRDIILEATSFQSIRYAEKVFQYMEPRRSWDPEIVWIHGGTGVGKSHFANRIAPGAWWAGKNLKWWQGYDGHPDVVFDNFTHEFVNITEMLRILDKFPYTVECKGSSRQLLAKRYIITSVKAPENVYTGDSQVLELMRRVTSYGKVFHLTGKETPEVLEHMYPSYTEEVIEEEIIEEEIIEGSDRIVESESEAGPADATSSEFDDGDEDDEGPDMF